MARGMHTHCGCCGREIKKAQAVQDGVPYCSTCYAREFKPVACVQCGKTMRLFHGEGEAVCKHCRTLDRTCIRCGKPVIQIGKVLDEGAVCNACSVYYREPKPCALCGQMSLHVSRDLKEGFDQPVCERCRSKNHITCPSCGKHRKPEGIDAQGRVVCKRCLERGGEAYVCPKCGRSDVAYHSKEYCAACYWKEKTLKDAGKAKAALTHEWSQKSWDAFIQELLTRKEAMWVNLRLERYLTFFAKLDATCRIPSQIQPAIMFELFGNDGMRRFQVPYGYLLKVGIIPNSVEQRRKEAPEEEAQRRMLGEASSHWYGTLLERYHNHLLTVGERHHSRGWEGERERFGLRTITQAIRAAHRFLVFLEEIEGISEVRQTRQDHLDHFILDHKGYRNGVRAFVRFLNREVKLFKALRVETVVQELPPGLFLSRDRYQELLVTWLGTEDGDIKESLVCLLLLLYAQTVKRVVRIRFADVLEVGPNQYRIAFGRTEIALAEEVGVLMGRYLATRKALGVTEDDWENQYLFPGRTTGSHLTDAAVTYYLRKYKVNAGMLFSSGIYYAYLSGMKHPKVLVKAFGITDYTAIKYLRMIDPRLMDEIEARKVVHG